MEAAAAMRTTRNKKGLDPRTLLVAVVVSVSVVVILVRVWVVVVVEAMFATPTFWITRSAKASKNSSAFQSSLLRRFGFIIDQGRCFWGPSSNRVSSSSAS